MTLNEQRAKLLRIIVGTILTSADDDNEVRAFGEILASDLKIGDDILKALSNISHPNHEEKIRKSIKLVPKANTSPKSEDMLYEVARQYGISKQTCLNSMKKSNPRFETPNGVGKIGLKDLIRKFASQSSPGQISVFLKSISSMELDPYLRNIKRDH